MEVNVIQMLWARLRNAVERQLPAGRYQNRTQKSTGQEGKASSLAEYIEGAEFVN